MKFVHLLLVPALLASASSFAAAPASQTPAMDMRCFLAAGAAAESISDPQTKQILMMSGLFYLGRVSSRMTDAETEALAKTELKALSSANMQTLLNQCGTFMIARSQAIQAIGQRMGAGAANAAPKTKK